jgi:hypothetical protein
MTKQTKILLGVGAGVLAIVGYYVYKNNQAKNKTNQTPAAPPPPPAEKGDNLPPQPNKKVVVNPKPVENCESARGDFQKTKECCTKLRGNLSDAFWMLDDAGNCLAGNARANYQVGNLGGYGNYGESSFPLGDNNIEIWT